MFLNRYFRASFGILERERLLVKGNVCYSSLVPIGDVKASVLFDVKSVW